MSVFIRDVKTFFFRLERNLYQDTFASMNLITSPSIGTINNPSCKYAVIDVHLPNTMTWSSTYTGTISINKMQILNISKPLPHSL